MLARELMTEHPVCCTPDTLLQDAASMMLDADCGCLPVIEPAGGVPRLVGVVTDRDIAVRGVAAGKGPEGRVRDVMTWDVCVCTPDTDVEQVEELMAQHQVRRIPVVDEVGACIGVIAQADLAINGAAASEDEVGRLVEQISEPHHPLPQDLNERGETILWR
ncbi:MAG: CBS domain-containing protein [Myxococcota bacterium]